MRMRKGPRSGGLPGGRSRAPCSPSANFPRRIDVSAGSGEFEMAVQQLFDNFSAAGFGGGLSLLWRSCKTRLTGYPKQSCWPPANSRRQRRVLLHVGLHKTGTTALQRFLSSAAAEFRAKGFLYPKSGRPEETPDAQHNIAWQLGGDRRFRASAGSLDDLAVEISSFPGDAIISSEDFESILGTPGRFLPMLKHPLLKNHSFTIVFWVRDQVSYLESLFFEMLRHRMALDALRFCEVCADPRANPARRLGLSFRLRVLTRRIAGTARNDHREALCLPGSQLDRFRFP